MDETINYRIKKYRKAKGLTQKQLGELLEVSQAMIAQYEKGLRHPKIETLCKVSAALEINLSDLLDADPCSIDESKNINMAFSKNNDTRVSISDNIIQKLDQLNYLGQAKAIEYITDLTEQKKYLKNITE